MHLKIFTKIHTRADSNRRSRLRRAVLYPLSYGCIIFSLKDTFPHHNASACPNIQSPSLRQDRRVSSFKVIQYEIAKIILPHLSEKVKEMMQTFRKTFCTIPLLFSSKTPFAPFSGSKPSRLPVVIIGVVGKALLFVHLRLIDFPHKEI